MVLHKNGKQRLSYSIIESFANHKLHFKRNYQLPKLPASYSKHASRNTELHGTRRIKRRPKRMTYKSESTIWAQLHRSTEAKTLTSASEIEHANRTEQKPRSPYLKALTKESHGLANGRELKKQRYKEHDVTPKEGQEERKREKKGKRKKREEKVEGKHYKSPESEKEARRTVSIIKFQISHRASHALHEDFL